MFSAEPLPSPAPPPAPWPAPAPGLEAVLAGWKAAPGTAPCIEASWTRPGAEARLTDWPASLHPAVAAALDAAGLSHPYDHQAQAIEAALAGVPVVVSTPTASGKSLCLHVPVLDRLARDPDARALYLLPTKALSRDQEASLAELAARVDPSIGVAVFDGDTPDAARRRIRDRARIVLTNPDMLHAGILPQHAGWSAFFAGLSHVVVDEVHAYRGVFGSHVANVLRRLRRVAGWHGATPRTLGASATIADPAAHFGRLTGARGVLDVALSGAPRGPLHVLLYNPPVTNATLGVRASALKEAARLTSELLGAGLRTIAFCRSRLDVEVLLRYLRRAAARRGLPADAVQGYRGGYLPDLRRAIEAGLRRGDVRAVVSTSALELGVDIGSLDACVLVGYPGSVASTWQRAGRAGRRERPALLLLVATSRAIDQHVVRSPAAVRDGRVEHARCDPDNLLVLLDHVRCAAAELPFGPGERLGDAHPEAFDAVAAHLAASGELVRTPAGLRHGGEPFPASRVGLRGVAGENFVVIATEPDAEDPGGTRVIAEVDRHGAPLYLHPQAIYSVGGRLYHVDRLDWVAHRAFVRPVEPDYFTDAVTHRQVAVLDVGAVRGPAGRGDVRVTERVVGFKKIRFKTHENVGFGDVDLPPAELVTQALWLAVEAGRAGLPPAGLPEALRAVGHALHHLMAWRLMTDAADIGRVVQIPDPAAADPAEDPDGAPVLYLYDRTPGGVGLCVAAFDLLPELLHDARTLIAGCTCTDGCPACIGPIDGAALPTAGPRPRPGALRLIDALIEETRP